MSHHKIDWEPEDNDTYKGFDVRDHGIHVDDVNYSVDEDEE